MLRGLLWLGFILVAFVLAVGFAGAGHGSYAPFAVFYGWGTLAARGVAKLASGGTETGAAIAFFAVPVVYPLFLAFSSKYVVERWGLKLYGGVIAIHAIGAVLAATQLEHGHLASPALVEFSYVVSFALLVILFTLDRAALEHMIRQRDEAHSTRE